MIRGARRCGRPAALAAVAAFSALPAFSPAGAAPAPVPSLRVHRVAHELAPDAFDDAEWQAAAPADSLTQQEPSEGAPATLGAECRAIATPTTLLLRFRLAQPPAEVVAHQLRRDADLTPDDTVSFVLDTWHDRRNAYYFATNPNGLRVDGLISEQRAPSLDWDSVWDVRVRVTAAGWEALFSLPFASLAFPGGADGTWGFNFARESRRRSERARWTGWRRPWQLHQVSHAGDLAGLPPLSARRLRQVTPYAAGAADRRENPSDTDLLGKAGLDARLGITSSIEADLTVNTDFAETEVDAQQFNFGRTSLFFPEKRSFFLQRSQVFEFGDKDTTIPFFSRRIGLSDRGEQIPIDAGLKVTGRSGGTELGALAVQTRAAAGEPRADFFVGRVKQDVGHSTYVGALVTDVERGGGAPRAQTWGVDVESNPVPELRINTYYVSTTRPPGATGKNDAGSFDCFYTGKNVRGEVQRAFYGAAYDPAAGFVPQTGIAFWYLSLGGVARPRVAGLQEVSLDLAYWPKDNEDGSPNERWQNSRLLLTWLNGANLELSSTDYDENLTEPLNLSGRAVIPVGRYRFRQQRAAGGTNPSRALSAQASLLGGSYYGGTRNGYSAQVDWKPSAHVAAQLLEQYYTVRLPGGSFDLSLFSLRVDWNPSVKLLTSAIVQSNNVAKLSNVQVIARWLIDPATDVFAVLSRQTGAGFERPGTRLTVKVRKSFDL